MIDLYNWFVSGVMKKIASQKERTPDNFISNMLSDEWFMTQKHEKKHKHQKYKTMQFLWWELEWLSQLSTEEHRGFGKGVSDSEKMIQCNFQLDWKIRTNPQKIMVKMGSLTIFTIKTEVQSYTLSQND